MKYYDKLIFEISRPGRVGYSLPKSELTIHNSQFPPTCFARHLPSSPR